MTTLRSGLFFRNANEHERCFVVKLMGGRVVCAGDGDVRT